MMFAKQMLSAFAATRMMAAVVAAGMNATLMRTRGRIGTPYRGHLGRGPTDFSTFMGVRARLRAGRLGEVETPLSRDQVVKAMKRHAWFKRAQIAADYRIATGQARKGDQKLVAL